MSYIEKEKLIKADIASIENRVRHAFNQGYDLGYKDGKANCSKNSTGSNTNNDLAQERYQDLIEYFGGEDVVLNDRKMFMAWLDRVRWYVKRVDELARELEQLKGTTKNDLGVECISRKAVIDELKRYFHDEYFQRTSIQDCRDCFIEDVLNHLPSVTPQLSSGLEKNSKKLEKDFGESDCISRQAVLDIAKASKSNWIDNSILFKRVNDLPSVTPQESKWIPVSERLPEESLGVLVWCPTRKNIYCACYEEKQWWIFGAYWEKVTEKIVAWRPLPTKPYSEVEE